MKRLLLVLFFVPLISFGQTCLYFEMGVEYEDNTEANKSLERIMAVIGASKNFVLISCSETNNVSATSYKGIRYILYDKEFMRKINSRTNDWSNLTILAHEVGHHINGHALDLTMYFEEVVEPKTLAVKREQELEADEFAGFIMAKLGAPLNLVQDAIAILSNNKDDTYSSHPSQNKRLNALMIGYNKATANSNTSKVNNDYIVDNSTISVEEYFNRGNEKVLLEDYYGGISDLTKAIEINPDFAQAYHNRGHAKAYLEDYYGAIADYTKAIEIDPNYALAYGSRGTTKAFSEDYYGAISDYNKAIEIYPNYARAYRNRGLAKDEIEDYYGAISDYTKAIEIDPNDARAYRNRGTTKAFSKDYYGAKEDFTKAIEIDPNDAGAYLNRGLTKQLLGDLKGACEDWKKAANLGYTDAAKWVKEDCN